MQYQDVLDYFQKVRFSRYSLHEFDQFFTKTKINFDLPVIHVTATNGKGSIVRYLESIYQTAGYKVGTFVSPTLKPTEMIRVDDKEISESDYLRIFSEYHDQFQKDNLSEFEIQTFIALKYFIEQKPDICIIEVGMGGTIDATNVIDSTILSIIGRVGIEHGQYLGRSESEIAKNKAGIIKDRTPVLTLRQSEDVDYAIKEEVRRNKSEVFYLHAFFNETKTKNGWNFCYSELRDLEIRTFAYYQIENAAMAVEAVTILQNRFPVSEEAIKKGLLIKPFLARYTILEKYPRIIIDGAHNPLAIQTLLKTLQKNNENIDTVLLATFKDKNLEKMLALLGADIPKIILTTYDHPRARGEMDYFLFLEDYPFVEDFREILKEYQDDSGTSKLLVTGGLDFAYRVLEYLQEN